MKEDFFARFGNAPLQRRIWKYVSKVFTEAPKAVTPKFNLRDFRKKFPLDEFDFSEGYQKLIEYITDIEQNAYKAGYDLAKRKP